MSLHNTFAMHGQSQDQTINTKVYVNPKFKKSLPHNNLMYFNPKFSSQLTQISQTNNVSNSKIYLNPNFIKSNNLKPDPLPAKNNNVTTITVGVVNSSSVRTVPKKPEVTHMTKSKYSIVRYNNENKLAETKPLEKNTTYKLTKYKSVSIKAIKKSLDSSNTADKLIVNQKEPPVPTQANKKYLSSSIPNLYASRYKIIKHSNKSVKCETKQPLINIVKSVPPNPRVKLNRKYLKKNNIPCPLFKKFGKCIRYAQGKCDFLHDKKHVSICRKFLNGVCHDKNCLLSHDLTSKKMPTCYFYLKGMCTKEACPYLHVKLNEKTKICTDFLNGYCEKGDSCLKRHDNVCPNLGNKGVCFNKQCSYPHNKTIKRKKTKLKMKSVTRSFSSSQLIKVDKPINNYEETEKVKHVADCRYYTEVKEETTSSDTCELIKPMRCKLGTLPSFIQL